MKPYLFPLLIAFSLLNIAKGQETVHSSPPIFGKYDPNADPRVQLKNAITEATASNKRILLEVGGEWCIWCHRLDTLFLKNPDVTEFLKKNYILVKINFSKENDNEEFLNAFPKIPGYPHIFVLESDGTLLHSQDTGKLEKGKGHDREKMLEFLSRWSMKQ